MPTKGYKKPADERRSYPLRVLLTPSEKQHLDALVATSTVATNAGFVRHLIMGIRPKARDQRAADHAELIRQLAKIGGNLNQIARDVNTGRTVEPSGFQDTIDQLQAVLTKVALSE